MPHVPIVVVLFVIRLLLSIPGRFGGKTPASGPAGGVAGGDTVVGSDGGDSSGGLGPLGALLGGGGGDGGGGMMGMLGRAVPLLGQAMATYRLARDLALDLAATLFVALGVVAAAPPLVRALADAGLLASLEIGTCKSI